MISLLYPPASLGAQNPLYTKFLTYQRLSGCMINSQWQILVNYTEERIDSLRSIDRLSSLHTTLLRSGLYLFGLEMEQKWQEDPVELVPDLIYQNWQFDDEGWLNTIADEIEVAEEVVKQCGQEKLLTKNDVSVLICGLRLLSVELEEVIATQVHGG